MDDWDSVSSDTPTDNKTGDWDAVSESQQRPAPARRRLPPDNLAIEGDESQSTHLSGQIIPVIKSFQEPPPDMSALPLPARSERLYKQITRDVLALLSTILFFVLTPILFHEFAISFLRTPLILFFSVPSYAIGIFIAAISGRKGFDVLFPILIGCIIGFVTVVILVIWVNSSYLVYELYFLLLLLAVSTLGVATYVVIQKIRR